jgi:hypothetical protein
VFLWGCRFAGATSSILAGFASRSIIFVKKSPREVILRKWSKGEEVETAIWAVS